MDRPNKLIKIPLIILLVFSLVIPITPSYGAGSSSAESPWPMFGHDPQHTRRSPYLGAQTNELKWRYATGGSVYSSPSIGLDSTIYVGSYDRKLYAINPDGTLRWSYIIGSTTDSSPAIDTNGNIYVGSADSKLYAINSDGSLKWTYATGGSIESSPCIDPEGTIYVGSNDDRLYAINLDGTLKWSYKTGGYIIGDPAISPDGVIYVGSLDKNLYAFNSDGTLKWRFTTGGGIYHSAPAIGPDGTVYVGSADYRLYAINPDGTLKWSYRTGYFIASSPGLGSDGTIYIGSYDNSLYAINPDGTLKWRFTTGDDIVSSPAIGSDGTIYIGSKDRIFYAINPDGTLKWSYTTGGYIYSSPSIDSDGMVYVGSLDYNLYAFGPGPTSAPTPRTIYVPDDYATIQAAVDAASGGDTIIVRAGTYTENVNVNKDHLTIKSQSGVERTIVQAANPNDHVFEVTADYVEISGFTVKGALGRALERVAGILFSGVENGTIFNNEALNNDVGIWVHLSHNNTVAENRASSNHDGIVFEGSSDNIGVSNIVKFNLYQGISIYSSSHNSLTYNMTISNGGAGIYLPSSSLNSVTNNVISNNKYGIGSDSNSTGNLIYLNNFMNNIDNTGFFRGFDNTWSSPSKITYTYSGKTRTNYLGNYWSDYTGTDTDNDGIGDTPYNIDSDKDNYPLIKPFENYIWEAPPPAPTGLTATLGDGVINLTWNSVTGATGYKVYYGTTSGSYGSPIDVGNKTSHQLTGLTNGVKYYIAVTAYNADGGESAKSTEISAIPTVVSTKFLTLPFKDSDIKIQQGWRYNAPIGPNPEDPYAHNGIDYIKGAIDNSSTWQSFDVVAAADGVAMQSSGGGYGTFVYIRHNEKDSAGNNYFTLYAHLDSVATKIVSKSKGDTDYSTWMPIKRGEFIGRAGATGVTDPTWIHLHFEVQRGGYPYGKTDPYDLYKTRDFYPGGGNYIGSGPNHLWTTDPPTPPPAVIKFKEGDIVRATANLNVRDDENKIIGTVRKGYIGVVKGSSQTATINGKEYTLWKINWEPWAVIEGWSAENWLLAVDMTDDVDWLARVIMSEASIGEPEEQEAVGWAVLNRLIAIDFYGRGIETNTIKQVIFPPSWGPQFSYNQTPSEGIRRLAEQLIQGRIPDPTGGATYFFSPISMPWEGDEGKFIERLNKHFNEFNTRGGLHQVPCDGQDKKAYFPDWAAPKEGTEITENTEYYRTKGDNREWRNLGNIRNWYFMFYRQYIRKLEAKIESPGELRIYDSLGRVTGLVDGKIVNEIPGSEYQNNTVTIFLPSDFYRYEAAGTGAGLYGLTVAAATEQETVTFVATDIPTSVNVLHQYIIDWAALSQGEEGVTLQIDSDGDGTFERTITGDSELTHDEFVLQTATSIDFDPDTLNLRSKGKDVTVYIELPAGYDVSQIDVSTIRLNGTVPALAKPTEIGDYDGDGIPDLMVKFDRASVIALFAEKTVLGNYEMEVTGTVTGMRFKGTVTIRVISAP